MSDGLNGARDSRSDIDWSVANVETLTLMWAAGASHSEIAAVIPNATRSAVAGKIMRLKLPARDKGHPTPVRTPRPASPTGTLPAPRPAPAPRPGKIAAQSRFGDTTCEAPKRRNQTNSLAEKIAIAETEPGLPERFKGEKPDGTGIKFNDLNSNNCHWPKGDPLDEDFEFCGGRAIPGMPYCSHHCRISYMPAAQRQRVHPRV